MTEDLRHNPLFSGLDEAGLRQIEKSPIAGISKKGKACFLWA